MEAEWLGTPVDIEISTVSKRKEELFSCGISSRVKDIMYPTSFSENFRQ